MAFSHHACHDGQLCELQLSCQEETNENTTPTNELTTVHTTKIAFGTPDTHRNFEDTPRDLGVSAPRGAPRASSSSAANPPSDDIDPDAPFKGIVIKIKLAVGTLLR
jgi:hypothetical protein